MLPLQAVLDNEAFSTLPDGLGCGGGVGRFVANKLQPFRLASAKSGRILWIT